MKKICTFIIATLLTFPISVASVPVPMPIVPEEKVTTHYDPHAEKLARKIVQQHDVDLQLAQEIVETAKQYQRDDFPKTQDILAIIAIESRFNPQAKTSSQIGLTQVDYKVWRKEVNKSDLYTIEGSIRQCVNILDLYYKQTGSSKGAIMAYNVGITAYKNGARPVGYYNKYKQVVHMYN